MDTDLLMQTYQFGQKNNFCLEDKKMSEQRKEIIDCPNCGKPVERVEYYDCAEIIYWYNKEIEDWEEVDKEWGECTSLIYRCTEQCGFEEEH